MTKTFEDAMQELEKIVKRLESGDVSLDESVSLYEQGIELKRFCEKRLKSASMKIEKIVEDTQQGVRTQEELSFDE